MECNIINEKLQQRLEENRIAREVVKVLLTAKDVYQCGSLVEVMEGLTLD